MFQYNTRQLSLRVKQTVSHLQTYSSSNNLPNNNINNHNIGNRNFSHSSPSLLKTKRKIYQPLYQCLQFSTTSSSGQAAPNSTTADVSDILKNGLYPKTTNPYIYDSYTQKFRQFQPRTIHPSPIPPTTVATLTNEINSGFLTINSQADDNTKPFLWYICGPTVYDLAHVGHARTYVCLDIISRILKIHFQKNIIIAMGITDIDDKILTRSAERGVDPIALARYYENTFMEDLRMLNVQPVDMILRVTEHIDPIIKMVQGILDNGFAYMAADGIYFDIQKFQQTGFSYGKLKYDTLGKDGEIDSASIQQFLSSLQQKNQKDQPESEIAHNNTTTSTKNDRSRVAGTPFFASESITRIELGEKRSADDFALWKLAKKDELAWNSPWGAGRPGWHIECSAMTAHNFGNQLDMHSGGVDLKFPHHCNEIAQAEAYFGWGNSNISHTGSVPQPGSPSQPPSEWCNIWLHTGHIHIDGHKMSKSLKNFFTIRDVLAMNFSADEFRMFCITHHYRSTIEWQKSQMEQATANIRSLRSFFDTIHWTRVQIESYQKNIFSSLEKSLYKSDSNKSDLNTGIKTTTKTMESAELSESKSESITTASTTIEENDITREQHDISTKIPSLVWSHDEIELVSRYQSLSALFSKSLADDFKTNLAIDALFEIVSITRKYAAKHNTIDVTTKEKYVCNIYILNTIEQFVHEKLSMFGFTFHQHAHNSTNIVSNVSSGVSVDSSSSSSSSPSSAPANSPPIASSMEVAEKFADFRAEFRQTLVDKMQNISRRMKNGDFDSNTSTTPNTSTTDLKTYNSTEILPLIRELLTLCDDSRNVTFPQLGYILKDVAKITKSEVEDVHDNVNVSDIDSKLADLRMTYYLRHKTTADVETLSAAAIEDAKKKKKNTKNTINDTEAERLRVRRQKEEHAQAQRERAQREKERLQRAKEREEAKKVAAQQQQQQQDKDE